MRLVRTTLFAAFAFGCGATPSTQIVTGTATDALAVRAISGTTVVTASAVASDGSFSLALPADRDYRLEVLTSAGTEPVYTDTSSTFQDLVFRVCQPGNPIDVGTIGPHHHGGSGDGSGGGGSGMGSGCIGGPGGPGGGHGGPGRGSAACDDPTSCGCANGSDCWSSSGPPDCGSDGDCQPPGGSGMCPDHPPGNIGCGSDAGSD